MAKSCSEIPDYLLSKLGAHGGHYVVDGEVYDFSEWKFKHPGGAQFFEVSYGRDISPVVYAYHKNPAVLKPLLAKYKVDTNEVKAVDVIDKYMNVPKFILPPGFEAARDVPTYDWTRGFLPSLQKKILEPEMQKKIKRANYQFDVTAAVILAFHITVCFPVVYYNVLPVWLLVVVQVLTRTSLAGVGHYHCHRAKDGIRDWAEVLFDIQYVGASVVLSDGHVMLHHIYTETPADVKRTVFNYMLTLPRIVRVPIFTLQKFTEFFSGHLLRYLVAVQHLEERNSKLKDVQFKLLRCYMIAEMFWAMYCGQTWMWCLQFFCTVWLNMFQIVASHDFELEREGHDYRGLDWGVFQIQNALDTYITGSMHVDIFLSAGLSCHRVHHVMPYQQSGFANIASLDAVKETCKEFGVKWEPTRHLYLDRVLPLACHYLTAPAQLPAFPKPVLVGGAGFKGFVTEHLQPKVLAKAMWNIVLGFTGATI
jgi:cytochrome b involved in lipid metabolism